LILQWRNDQDAVANSLTGRSVDPKEHAVWYAKRLARVPLFMWIAEVDGSPVGSVRIDKEGASGRVAIAVARAARGRGLGTTILRAMLDAVASRQDAIELRAEVLVSNEASLRAFRKAGFEEAATKDRVTEFVWRGGGSEAPERDPD
jgi:RimJ/RimL family protein N-acetyltransferase